MKTKLITLFILFIVLAMNSRSDAQDVFINEILYDSGGSDKGCFIELFGKPNLKLNDYKLIGVNGDNGQAYGEIKLSGHTISPDGFFVIAQDKNVLNADMIDSNADYQNGPDNIELWYIDKKVDSVGYGDFTNAVFAGEGTPTLDLSEYSIGRRKDGFDSNDNSVDFVGLAVLSPGRPNWPGVSVERKEKLASIWGLIKKK